MANTRVIAYIRVSTDKQEKSGLSLEAQRAKVVAYAAAYDLTLVDVLVDAMTAKNLHRPVLRQALAALKAGKADALLVVKLDRLTRSVRDLGELIENHFGNRADLLSVGDHIDTRSASGRLILNVLVSVAQWEREAISERTKAAAAVVRERGERWGAVPYGMALASQQEGERRLVPVPEEQEIVRRALDGRAAGMSLRAIASTLPTTRTGSPWTAEQVRRILIRYG